MTQELVTICEPQLLAQEHAHHISDLMVPLRHSLNVYKSSYAVLETEK